MIKIQPDEFQILAQYIHTLCGVNLAAKKAYLIESRLSNLVEETGCSSYIELYQKAKSDLSGKLPRKIIDCITTGETSFFRDAAPFELLRHKILPDIIDRHTRSFPHTTAIPIHIWSAACSTGQEVYSIATVLQELLGDPSLHNIRLLGTDISNEAIARASQGIYNHIEIERGLPQQNIERYFHHHEDGWKIKDEIRALATFKKANLLEDFSGLGKFDIVLCRNVAIYFTEQDKLSLFQRLIKMLNPNGILIIGSTESITSICPSVESHRHMRSTYYQLKNGQK